MRGKQSVNRKFCLLVLGFGIFQFVSVSILGKPKPAEFSMFLKTHCFECHGINEQKGEIRLDNLSLHLGSHENIELCQMDAGTLWTV